jgi:hypothetical protein
MECNTCRHNYTDDGNWKPCPEKKCIGYCCWKPIEKPAEKPKAKINFSAGELNPTITHMTPEELRENRRRYESISLKPTYMTPEEYEYCTYEYCTGVDKPKYTETVKPPKKAKETKMWKKLRKRCRRITMAWDLFGLYLLCKLVNPWIYKLWHWLLPSCFDGKEGSTDYAIGEYAGHWIITACSIAVILGALYGLNSLAAWWYNEEAKAS